MRVRVRLGVVNAFVYQGESVTLTVNATTVVVSFDVRSRHDPKSGSLSVEARSQVAVTPSVADFLEAWKPGGYGLSVPIDVMEYCEAVVSDHRAACRSALQLLRWRYGADS